MVKKGYRDPAYHNWRHALSVAHFSYLLYRQCEQLPLLSELEILALFVSCLAHDIDHRGTNNAFQVSSVRLGYNFFLYSPVYHGKGRRVGPAQPVGDKINCSFCEHANTLPVSENHCLYSRRTSGISILFLESFNVCLYQRNGTLLSCLKLSVLTSCVML